MYLKRSFSILAALLVLILTVSVSFADAQCHQKHTVPLNVFDTKMAPYRALAQLIFESFEDKDYATSATLAKILDSYWDVTAGNPKDGAKSPMAPDLFHKIDPAMDAFAKPIIDYGKGLTHNQPATLPDAKAVEAAYRAYLEALKLGD